MESCKAYTLRCSRPDNPFVTNLVPSTAGALLRYYLDDYLIYFRHIVPPSVPASSNNIELDGKCQTFPI